MSAQLGLRRKTLLLEGQRPELGLLCMVQELS